MENPMSLTPSQITESTPNISTQQLKEKTKFILNQYLSKFLLFFMLFLILVGLSIPMAIISSLTLGLGQFVLQGPLMAVGIIGAYNIITKGDIAFNDISEKIQANIVPIIAVSLIYSIAITLGAFVIVGAPIIFALFILAPQFTTLYKTDIAESFTAAKDHFLANWSTFLGTMAIPLIASILSGVIAVGGGVGFAMMSASQGEMPGSLTLLMISLLLFGAFIVAVLSSIYLASIPLAYCLILEELYGNPEGFGSEAGTGLSDGSALGEEKPRPMF